MTIKELYAKAQAEDSKVVTFEVFKFDRYNLEGANQIELLDDGEYSMDREVVPGEDDWQVMDEDEYNRVIMRFDSDYADFNTWYDCGDGAKVLVIGLREEEPKYWYAYETDEEDNDWGTGTFDKEEALETLRNNDGIYQIAVIEDGSDPVCVDVITRDMI